MYIWGPNGTIKLSDPLDAAGLVFNPLGRIWAPDLCKAHGGLRPGSLWIFTCLGFVCVLTITVQGAGCPDSRTGEGQPLWGRSGRGGGVRARASASMLGDRCWASQILRPGLHSCWGWRLSAVPIQQASSVKSPRSWGGGTCPDLPFGFEHLDQSTCAAVSWMVVTCLSGDKKRLFWQSLGTYVSASDLHCGHH